MNLEVIHPREHSLQAVMDASEQCQTVRRSPHVGNLNPEELALIFGLDSIDVILSLEMVDTIQGSDNYSSPRHVYTSGQKVPIASHKEVKSKVVGKCQVNSNEKNEEQLLTLGIIEGQSLIAVHMDPLEEVLPSSVNVRLSSELFASVGENVLRTVLNNSAPYIERPVRYVTCDGKINPLDSLSSTTELFGLGEEPLRGALLPLEAMIAFEAVKSTIENNDKDSGIVHIGGLDMCTYTENPVVMGSVKNILKASCSDLGIGANVTVEYVVPNRKAILSHTTFSDIMPIQVQSQHDLVKETA